MLIAFESNNRNNYRINAADIDLFEKINPICKINFVEPIKDFNNSTIEIEAKILEIPYDDEKKVMVTFKSLSSSQIFFKDFSFSWTHKLDSKAWANLLPRVQEKIHRLQKLFLASTEPYACLYYDTKLYRNNKKHESDACKMLLSHFRKRVMVLLFINVQNKMRTFCNMNGGHIRNISHGLNFFGPVVFLNDPEKFTILDFLHIIEEEFINVMNDKKALLKEITASVINTLQKDEYFYVLVDMMSGDADKYVASLGSEHQSYFSRIASDLLYNHMLHIIVNSLFANEKTM